MSSLEAFYSLSEGVTMRDETAICQSIDLSGPDNPVFKDNRMEEKWKNPWIFQSLGAHLTIKGDLK